MHVILSCDSFYFIALFNINIFFVDKMTSVSCMTDQIIPKMFSFVIWRGIRCLVIVWKWILPSDDSISILHMDIFRWLKLNCWYWPQRYRSVSSVYLLAFSYFLQNIAFLAFNVTFVWQIKYVAAGSLSSFHELLKWKQRTPLLTYYCSGVPLTALSRQFSATSLLYERTRKICAWYLKGMIQRKSIWMQAVEPP